MASVISEKAILAVAVVLLSVLILTAGVMGLFGLQLLTMPATDFFGFMEGMFNFIGDRIGLLGRGTSDFFCGKELKVAGEVCKISQEQLDAYCKSPAEEQTGTCQKPPAEMKEFCGLSPKDRTWACGHQAEFRKACGQIGYALTGSVPGLMSNMPFCK